MIDIYTDGSCLDNPGGPGGWAAIVVEDGKKRILSGCDPNTTNNRMEVEAAIGGLGAIPKRSSATIHSDSTYLVNTMTKNWKRKKNTDLWGKLDSLVAGRSVRWKWVRGHAGHPLNEEADRIANQAAVSVANGGKSRAANASSIAASRSVQAAPKQELTHLDAQGRAQMVDVGDKAVTRREAVARGFVAMKPETLALITGGKVSKGDVFATARLAGIMAAKQTAMLIPYAIRCPSAG